MFLSFAFSHPSLYNQLGKKRSNPHLLTQILALSLAPAPRGPWAREYYCVKASGLAPPTP